MGICGLKQTWKYPSCWWLLQSQQAVPRPGPSAISSHFKGARRLFPAGWGTGLCFHIASVVYTVSEKETTYNQVYTIHIHIQVYHIHVPLLRVRWPPNLYQYKYIVHTCMYPARNEHIPPWEKEKNIFKSALLGLI